MMATTSNNVAAMAAVSASDFNQWLHAMKMVARLPGGMPPEFRRKLWLALSEQHLQTKTVDWPREEQRCMCADDTGDDDEELGIQIVKDLHRTGSSLCSGPAGSLNQGKLKRVLMGYARWNPEVGYCQGFNMLGALILQVMDKDDIESLKVMIFLIEGILPTGYFNGSLGGLQADMAVFRDLLGARLPKLAKHLQRLQGPAGEAALSEPPLTNVFTMQWFLTLFCTCLPINCVLRVWDLVLIEGSDVLLRTALAIWGLLEERILAAKSADDFYCKMGMLSGELLNGHLFDSNGLIQKVVDLGPIPELQKMRDKHLYNVTPWRDKRGLRFFFSDDEADSDDEASSAWSLRLGGVRRGSFGLPAPNLNVGAGRGQPHQAPALDIGLLRRQYDKLRERQRQAHIILTSTARQTVAESSAAAGALPAPVNQYLMGRNAIVSSKGRRIGPPAGAIPPMRNTKVQALKAASGSASGSSPNVGKSSSGGSRRGETLQWKDINASSGGGGGTRSGADGSEQHSDAGSDGSEVLGARNVLNKSPSAVSNNSSTSDRSATSASFRSSRKRSESSSYSDDSDGNSSTSTSLCDEEGGGGGVGGLSSVPSSLEASPMRRVVGAGQQQQLPDNKSVVSAEDTEVMEMLRTAKLTECISELNKQNLCENCDVLSCDAEGDCAVVTAKSEEEEEVLVLATSLSVNDEVAEPSAESKEKLDTSEKDSGAHHVIMDVNISTSGIDLSALGSIVEESVPMETIQEQPDAEDKEVELAQRFEAQDYDEDDDDVRLESPEQPFDLRRTSESFEKYLQINFPSTLDPDPISPTLASPRLELGIDIVSPKRSPTSESPIPNVSIHREAPSPPLLSLCASPPPNRPTADSVEISTSQSPQSPLSHTVASGASEASITNIPLFPKAQLSPPAAVPTTITSTSQLSPIADFSKYLNSACSISPLRTPAVATNYLDYSPSDVSSAVVTTAAMVVSEPVAFISATTTTMTTTDIATISPPAAVEFRVNDEGVTNEYFERVTGAPERPTRLELLSSTSDDAAAGGGSFVNDDLTRDIYVNRFVAGELARAVNYVDDHRRREASEDDVFEVEPAIGLRGSPYKEHAIFMKEKSISLDEATRDEGGVSRPDDFQATSCPENSSETPLYGQMKQSDRVSRIIEENSRILHSLLRRSVAVVEALEPELVKEDLQSEPDVLEPVGEVYVRKGVGEVAIEVPLIEKRDEEPAADDLAHLRSSSIMSPVKKSDAKEPYPLPEPEKDDSKPSFDAYVPISVAGIAVSPVSEPFAANLDDGKVSEVVKVDKEPKTEASTYVPRRDAGITVSPVREPIASYLVETEISENTKVYKEPPASASEQTSDTYIRKSVVEIAEVPLQMASPIAEPDVAVPEPILTNLQTEATIEPAEFTPPIEDSPLQQSITSESSNPLSRSLLSLSGRAISSTHLPTIEPNSTDIDETLSSIKNTIRSIDSLCQKDDAGQRSRDKTVEIIESLNEFRYRKAQLTGDSLSATTASSNYNPYSRNSRQDIRREVSPRRQSRCDEQRDESQSLFKRERSSKRTVGGSINDLSQRADDDEPTGGSSARYSYPPGSFADFEAPDARINHPTTASDRLEPIAPYTAGVYGERKLEIRHTTVTSTFYDRFLSQKQETRRSQLNVRLQASATGSASVISDKSPSSERLMGDMPAVITQAYLNSLRLPGAKTTSTTTISSEVSPPRRSLCLGEPLSGSMSTISTLPGTLMHSGRHKSDVSTATAAYRSVAAAGFQSCDNIPGRVVGGSGAAAAAGAVPTTEDRRLGSGGGGDHHRRRELGGDCL